jgi:hypothetical protein
MKATLALVAVLVFVFVQEAQARHERAYSQKQLLRISVVKHRSVTWRLQDKAGVPRWPTAHKERHASIDYLHHLLRLWKERRQEAQSYYHKTSSHLAGWRCITNGAYPGAPHEGNGVNGQYSGPLGMTNPWMGHSGDWVHMNSNDVYAIADHEAAAQGYAYSWMKGQWPNTFPPCAGHF